jgi:type IV secretory pathway TraG/TraD family ATPase VirD4
MKPNVTTLPPLPARDWSHFQCLAYLGFPVLLALTVNLLLGLFLQCPLSQSVPAALAGGAMAAAVAYQGYPVFFRQEEYGWSLPPVERLKFLGELLTVSGVALAVAAVLFAAVWWFVSGLAAWPAAALVLFFAARYGHHYFVSHHVRRGRTLLTQAEHRELALARMRPGDPGIQCGPLLLSTAEPEHTLLLGMTGVGKTNVLRLIMQSALSRVGTQKDLRAMVFSPKGDALGLLAGMGVPARCIKFLHPFDRRKWSVAWDIGKDCQEPEVARQVAAVLIPEEEGPNKFFSDAAREVLVAVLVALILQCGEEYTFRDVMLAAKSRGTLKALLGKFPDVPEVYDVLGFLDEGKTSANILATVLSRINAYAPIAAAWSHATEKVSLRDWVKGEFILVMPFDTSIRAQLGALNRLLFELAAQLVLAQPDSKTRRTWFFLDEARELQHLETLRNLLTFGRSRGACCVLALQDVEGFQDAMGSDKKGNEITGQPTNMAFFRLQSPATAEWASKVIGDQEIYDDSAEGGLMTRPAVLPSELQAMPKPSRATGLWGYYLTADGVSRGFLPGEWLATALLPPHPDVPDFVARPREEKFIRRWDDADLERLGLKPPAAATGEAKHRFRFTKGGTPLSLEPKAEGEDRDEEEGNGRPDVRKKA